MNCNVGWTLVGLLNLVLWSTSVIFIEIHMNIYMIIGKIFFEILVLFELCVDSVYVATKWMNLFH